LPFGWEVLGFLVVLVVVVVVLVVDVIEEVAVEDLGTGEREVPLSDVFVLDVLLLVIVLAGSRLGIIPNILSNSSGFRNFDAQIVFGGSDFVSRSSFVVVVGAVGTVSFLRAISFPLPLFLNRLGWGIEIGGLDVRGGEDEEVGGRFSLESLYVEA